MTIYKLIFKLNDLIYHTSIYTNDNTPDNLQIQETNDNRLKLNDETMHKFIARILFYSNPSLKVTIKNRLKKLIGKTDIVEKSFVAGVDTIDEKPHQKIEFDE